MSTTTGPSLAAAVGALERPDATSGWQRDLNILMAVKAGGRID
jgi:hypothetical protein